MTRPPPRRRAAKRLVLLLALAACGPQYDHEVLVPAADAERAAAMYAQLLQRPHEDDVKMLPGFAWSHVVETLGVHDPEKCHRCIDTRVAALEAPR